MGAKTALLAFADGDIRPALLGATRSERAEAEALVRQVHPGYVVEPADDRMLADCVYPPDDFTYATVLAGAEVLCDGRFALDRPSDALFGFVLEGYPDPDDVDADEVHLHGFRVTDPTGTQQAAREAGYAEALRTMRRVRTYRMGPGGRMEEVDLGNL